jgi:agmatine deiminase
LNDVPPRLMPAEWEPHAATWIAWPHHEPDWPGKLEPIPWVYTEIVRALHRHERVEVLCHDDAIAAQARRCLDLHAVRPEGYRLHVQPTDRVWLRDSGPTGVKRPDGSLEWVHWRFTAWAKYDNYQQDAAVPLLVERVSGRLRVEAVHGPQRRRVVLEGGSIDTDGEGTLLTTEECLLSEVQYRNPGMGRADYEAVFAEYLGIRKVIWLGNGCAGDDTHGHVDDIARFVAPATVVAAYEPDPKDDNHEPLADNVRRLKASRDAAGRPLRVVTLPMPQALHYGEWRLPASYANFYIANGVVIVPTFNDPNDRIALNTLADLFPGREVRGVHAVDLVLGFGTLHCLTQQQPVG